VLEVIQGKLVVSNRKKKDIVADLVKGKYLPIPVNKGARPKIAGALDENESAEDDDSEEEEGAKAKISDFDYLLSMPILNLTMEKVTPTQIIRTAN